MVKIRLRRTGAKKQPHYRVVVTDAKMPRDGRFLETIGHYNPRTDPPTVEIDAERALYWLSVGAQPSAAVKRLLDREGILSQVGAVRKGEVSIEKLAADFRQTHAEAEAGAAAVLEPVYLGQAEPAPEEPVAAEEPAEAGALEEEAWPDDLEAPEADAEAEAGIEPEDEADAEAEAGMEPEAEADAEADAGMEPEDEAEAEEAL